jgi:hypothetical protein
MKQQTYTREQVLEILELQRNASKAYGITNILDMYAEGERAETIGRGIVKSGVDMPLGKAAR